jgi:hypothetical protein
MQAERLLAALDANDFATLGAVSARLAAVASSSDLPRVAELATELNEAVASKYNAEMALSSLRELLDLCRSVQTDMLSRIDYPLREAPTCRVSR